MEKSFKMGKFFRFLCVVMMLVMSLSVAGCFDDDEPGSSGSGSSTSYNNKGMKDHSPAGILSAGACMMLTRVGISRVCMGPWQASIWDSSLKTS